MDLDLDCPDGCPLRDKSNTIVEVLATRLSKKYNRHLGPVELISYIHNLSPVEKQQQNLEARNDLRRRGLFEDCSNHDRLSPISISN